MKQIKLNVFGKLTPGVGSQMQFIGLKSCVAGHMDEMQTKCNGETILFWEQDAFVTSYTAWKSSMAHQKLYNGKVQISSLRVIVDVCYTV